MMIVDNSQNINDFSEYLKDKLDSISKISEENHILFQKVLYVAFLDSLSAAVYPEITEHNKRFNALIDNFSCWKEKDHISLTYFGELVSMSSHKEMKNKYNFVEVKIQYWKAHMTQPVFISEDPSYEEMNKLWDDKFKYKKLDLNHFKHSNLLYQFRNTLVHQFQMKNEFDNEDLDQPFYRVIREFGTNLPLRIELIYPALFLKNISEIVLQNVIKYFENKNINPFPDYYAGDYWLEKLN